MPRRLFDRDGTRVEWFHWDHSDPDHFTIETIEDCAPLVRQVAAAADNPDGLKADGMRHEADVPHSVVERAFREGWFHDRDAWKRWANDPDNRAFRVQYNGRVKTL